MAELSIAFVLRGFSEGGILLAISAGSKALLKAVHPHGKPRGILAKESEARFPPVLCDWQQYDQFALTISFFN
jgi:hypothetical protein